MIINRRTPNDAGATSILDEAWREAYRLVQSLRFSGDRGDYARGEHVSVLIDIQPGDAPEAFHAGILIFPLGGEPVEVNGFPIALAGWAKDHHVMRRGETDRRGFVAFRNLPQGEYRLCAPKAVLATPDRIGFARAVSWSTGPPSLRLEEYRSDDGSLVCTLYETTDGELVLSFDVISPEAQGSAVEYALVEEPTGMLAMVEVRGEARPLAGQAELRRGTGGHYLGRASLGYHVTLPGRYSLRAYLVLPGGREGES